MIGVGSLDAMKRPSPNPYNNKTTKIQQPVKKQPCVKKTYKIDCTSSYDFASYIINEIPEAVINQSAMFRQMIENGNAKNNIFDITIMSDIMELVLDYMRFLANGRSCRTIKIKLKKDERLTNENRNDFIAAINYLKIEPLLLCLLDQEGIEKNGNELHKFLTTQWFYDDNCFATYKNFGILPQDAPDFADKNIWHDYVQKLISEKRYFHLQATLDCLCSCRHLVDLVMSIYVVLMQETKKILNDKDAGSAKEFYQSLPPQMSTFKMAVFLVGSLMYEESLDKKIAFKNLKYPYFHCSFKLQINLINTCEIAVEANNNMLFDESYIRFVLPLLPELIFVLNPGFEFFKMRPYTVNLTIKNCYLRQLPQETHLLNNMTMLTLTENSLCQIPHGYIPYSVQILDIGKNYLTVLPIDLFKRINDGSLVVNGLNDQYEFSN